MAAKITFYKRDGKLTKQSAEILRECFNALPDGAYALQIAEKNEGYTPTRYRYYFGHLVPEILDKCAHLFRFIGNGEERIPQTSEEMHMILKSIYNPMTVIAPNGRVFTTHQSTTNLNDRDFAGRYIDTIMADFSAPPYLCEFQFFEDWRDMMRERNGVQVFPNN